MGIEPAEPGYGKINIKPQPGDLKWAKMKLPTIRGEITVDLSQDPGNWFTLATSIPANTTANIYLPKLAGKYVLTVDGKVVKNGKIEGNWVVFNSASGSHRFVIRKI
jgi:hypothetical protein